MTSASRCVKALPAFAGMTSKGKGNGRGIDIGSGNVSGHGMGNGNGISCVDGVSDVFTLHSSSTTMLRLV